MDQSAATQDGTSAYLSVFLVKPRDAEMLAPIGDNRLPGDRECRVRGEKPDHVRDRDGRKDSGILLERRVHRAGRDRVYAYAVLYELFAWSETFMSVLVTENVGKYIVELSLNSRNILLAIRHEFARGFSSHHVSHHEREAVAGAVIPVEIIDPAVLDYLIHFV